MAEEKITASSSEKNSAAQRDEDYVYVYRGDALNGEELFQLSAQEDIKLVRAFNQRAKARRREPPHPA